MILVGGIAIGLLSFIFLMAAYEIILLVQERGEKD